jgi:CRP-like cAMP-binding protein
MVKRDKDRTKMKQSQTATAESKTIEIAPLNEASVLESGLRSCGLLQHSAVDLLKYYTKLNYDDGKLIFSQGSPANHVMWVVKGVVREVCPNPSGTQTLVRLATPGDILGLADRVNERGEWTRRFEAWAASRCVLATVTRDNVRNLLSSMPPDELIVLAERANSAASDWIQYYATFLGLSFRERLEIVLAELGRKLGVPDKDGILIAFELTHSDLAEMIGSSRPVVGRLTSEMIEDGAIARRDRKYVLMRGGSIEARLNQHSRASHVDLSPRMPSPALASRTISLRPQHKWAR